MTQQQAAEQLRLLLHWIQAFESNRFDSLVAPVYSRGYLRKYAILLDLPPEEILARYEKLHDIPATPPLAPIKPTASAPIKTSRAPAWLGAAALASVGAVLVLTQMDPPATQSGATTQPQVVATMTPVATSPAPAPLAAADTDAATPPEPSTAEAIATTDAAALPVSTTEGATSETLAPNVAAEIAAPAAESSLTPVSVETPPAPPSATSQPAPVEAAIAEEPLARLQVPVTRNGRNLNVKLSFKGKSWATVYAADGTRLLYELGRRGRPRVVSSPPPLTVIVGAIDAVEMRVNDKLVTIPRQPGKESIKFILDVDNGPRDARSAADVGSGG